MDLAIEGGFGDSVLGAQSVFRALMDALSRPGVPQVLGSFVVPPAPLTADLGAVALTMCDHDATLWLDPVLAISPAVGAWLQFHAGIIRQIRLVDDQKHPVVGLQGQRGGYHFHRFIFGVVTGSLLRRSLKM